MKTLRRFVLAALFMFLCLLAAVLLVLMPRGADLEEETPEDLSPPWLPPSYREEARRPARPRFRDYLDPEKGRLLSIFLPEADPFLQQKKQQQQQPSLPAPEPGPLKVYRPATEVQDTPCVRLDTPGNSSTPICIYPPTVDKLMSSFINDFHTWEQEQLVAMATTMERDVTLGLLDLGCSLGVYTLSAAMMGRHVIAVDALQSNLDLLSKSLTLGGLQENVTLLHYAVSDRHERMEVVVPEDGNTGGTYVTRLSGKTANVTGRPLVDTILLDDLVPLIKTPRLFIKMDIEGSELRALRGASLLFQTIDVRFVLMEWMLHRTQAGGAEMVYFMLRNGMLPYSDVAGTTFLQPDKYGAWPDNVFWVKR